MGEDKVVISKNEYEELIRTSERLRFITVILKNTDSYFLKKEYLYNICGIEVEKEE